MSEKIGILDLLRLKGFDPNPRRAKLVRHQEQGVDIHDFLLRGWLEAYQSFQRRPRFDNLDFLVSFIGIGGTQARFVGVYELLGRKSGAEGKIPKGCPHRYWLDEPYFYEMRKLLGFEELENRVIIEWGKGTRSWYQWPTNKQVVEILREGGLLPLFDDYLDVALTYNQLKALCSKPNIYRDWHARLSAVAGVYLVLDTIKGEQYVGSASGTGGIWSRWASYAIDGHGGNKKLRDLIEKDRTAYSEAFTYSILQILPLTFAESEVLQHESLFKRKLGSRAHGLNVN